jgi:hypothetical protein
MDRRFRSPRLEDFADVWKLKNSWTKVRFIGPVTSYYEFWFQIRSSTGRIIPIQKLCRDWNPEPGEMDGNSCPYRKAGLNGRAIYVVNAIIRSLQQRTPNISPERTAYEKKSRHIDKETVRWKEDGSKSWTPIRVLRIPPGIAQKIQALSLKNTWENQAGEVRSYDLAHPKYGRDVVIKYDKDEEPKAMYGLRAGQRTKLIDEESAYLRYPLNVLKPETLEAANEAWTELQPMLIKADVYQMFEL